jgi:quinohemoprotein amine dehydrogenase
MLRQVCRLILLSGLCAVSLVHAQAPEQTPAAKASAEEEGIPIRNELVQAKCGACHKADAQGRMSRISYRRATPENWERTIKRMATLNNVALEPADARNILKYLADRQGLSPEEVRPIAFDAERRVVEYTYAADKETADLCSSCHSMARVLSERRTKQEWELLVAMHRGYYPLVDNQPMRRNRPPTAVHPTPVSRWTKRSTICRRRCRCERRTGPHGQRPCRRPDLPDDGPSPVPPPARESCTARLS